MSKSKRLFYEYESHSSDSEYIFSNEDDDAKSLESTQNIRQRGCTSSLVQNGCENEENLRVEIRRYQSRQKPKCLSKNAKMARENRLRKKIYVAKLEKKVECLKSDNSKLSSIIDNQSFLLTQLKNEVKYLRGVLANSSDISKLLKNIQQTDMPIGTSLNNSFGMCSTVRENVPIARKTMHPWDEKTRPSSSFSCDMYPISCSDDLDLKLPLTSESDLIPYLMDETDMPEECDFSQPLLAASLEEHNYTNQAWLRNLGELQISLLKLNHQFKSLKHLVDEIGVGRMSIV